MADSVVYFIEHGNLIKIGYSTNLERRLTAVPGRLLNYLPGGPREEAEYHARFADLREYGEWFRAEPALTDFLSSLPVCDPVRPWRPVPRPRPVAVNGPVFADTMRTAQDGGATFEELLALVRAYDRPVDRAMAAGALALVRLERITEIRKVRDEGIAELRAAGWGYDRIATALGITKARVAQLVKGK